MKIIRTFDDELITEEELFRQFIVATYYKEFKIWKGAIVKDEVEIT